MAVQLAVTTRNARLDAIEVECGTAPILRIRTGPAPANCATADAGTVLCSLTLPADWMLPAAAGSKAKSATAWTAGATAAGTAAHFRLYDAGGTVCHLQGTVGQGAGDLSLDNSALSPGQVVTVTGFTLTDANS